MLNSPVVFISYSWESIEHTTWVKAFADRLIKEEGINVLLDQYDIQLGDRQPQSMELLIGKADYVLVICTPEYKYKADNRRKGVGYEGNIISQDIYSGSDKIYIPILRKGTFENSIPKYLGGANGADLSGNPYDEKAYRRIVDRIKGISRKPPMAKIGDDNITKKILEYIPYYSENIENVAVFTKTNRETVYMRSNFVHSGNQLKNIKLINKESGQYVLVDLFSTEECQFIINAAFAFDLIPNKNYELVINGKSLANKKDISGCSNTISEIYLQESI